MRNGEFEELHNVTKVTIKCRASIRIQAIYTRAMKNFAAPCEVRFLGAMDVCTYFLRGSILEISTLCLFCFLHGLLISV